MTARVYGRPEISIGQRPVGPGHPCYVIAEAGANHNRDLDTAKRLIDVAAESGSDAVKFQTYTAEGLYSRKTPNPSYLKNSSLLKDQETVWELIKRVEIPWEWHEELASHAAAAGIDFLSTPFEEAAVDLLETVKVPAYKIASYEITHLPLIEYAARTGKPLLLSTGMASLADIERALDVANEAGCEQVALLHCAINYPPRFEDLNLRAISTLASAFQVPIGWSDHTPGHTADVAAVTLGATLVEKHYTLSRDQEGPDHAFALEPDELTAMVKAIREAEASLGTPVKRVTPAEAEMYRIGRRSLVAARDLPAGTVVTREDIAVKRPGYGIPVHELDAVLGRTTSEAIEADEILQWPMFG
ncbi:pseudaminic acid synthase [Motilibacter aurantiacus]|uniref:pseudaminic acid synthase n=1 Tax=Motilibacter aurantiacus TaxID=2714955 RepID=UPI001407CCE7|nr:pseudaminic acid synthase [Motilibacter aurantiacus]NHC46379.1 pseudaminic acid synthase [Motilibacter aurantiacus]